MDIADLHPSLNANPTYLSAEKDAVAQVLALGVTAGDPVDLTAKQQASGHFMCRFHLVDTATGEEEDGGEASTLLGYLADGTYPGPASRYTLVPIRDRGTI